MNGDYIKINRSILEWEWYGNINTCRLFVHMLLKANWKEGKFEGTTVPRGSFVSSVNNLSAETELTVDEIRTAIKHLKCTGEITSKSHSKYSVFTVVNYNVYQDVTEQNPKQFPSSSQSIPVLFPTIEEKKEGKNISVNACARFEEFWSAYPKKTARLIAEQEYMQLVTSGIAEDALIIATCNYAEFCKIQNTKEQFIKNPSNWLKDSVWVDYTAENYKKPEVKAAQKKNSFNNFSQRSYDYSKLEDKLLRRE